MWQGWYVSHSNVKPYSALNLVEVNYSVDVLNLVLQFLHYSNVCHRLFHV